MLFNKPIGMIDSQIKAHSELREKLVNIEKKINTLDEDDRLAVYIYMLRNPVDPTLASFNSTWLDKVFEYAANKAKQQLKEDFLWDKQGYCQYMEYADCLLKEVPFEQATRVAKASIELLGKFR